MRRRALLAAPLALSGCALFRRRRPPAPPPAIHAVLGGPYRAGGVWRYPRAEAEYDETGLATVATAHPALATDGAPWDPGALLAAHPTLQLPAVLRVTNLETGREVLVRLDDRGPADPGRLLALSPRAAALLGTGTDLGVLRVRVRIEDGPTRQLATTLGEADAPALQIAAAPVGAVQTENLGPPVAVRAALVRAAGSSTAATVPLRLPETVAVGPVFATSLWIDAGGFGGPRYASVLAARLAGLGASVVRSPRARPEVAYRVRIGPGRRGHSRRRDAGPGAEGRDRCADHRRMRVRCCHAA